MTRQELDALLRAMNAAKGKESPVAVGFEYAKVLVTCAICGVATARPVRIWKDGKTLVDVCKPCQRNRSK
ncbi:MAG TPA: hypothetical protein VK673_21950 [Chthoniobacterales bacterium]|nr:hypothetical protein [Chthoniobacterales bacterium]